MPPQQSVFLLGAGYVGLHVIENLLDAGHSITTLVRNPELATALSEKGVKTIFGTLDDVELIKAEAAQHEIIINTSSSDHLPSVEAVLAGVQQRVSQDLQSIFIHTSGAAVLLDDAKGMYKSNKIYRDDDPASVDALPPSAPHRNVDLAIIQTARKLLNKARIIVLIPPVVYGLNPSHERLSMALPTLVRFALKHGFSGVVGEGQNVWSGIHVADLGQAYMAILANLESASPSVLECPYFFVDNGKEFSWAEAAENVGRILHKLGKITSPEPRTFDQTQYEDVFGPFTENIAGGNARSRAVRLHHLGWVPREKSMWASMEEDEIPYMLAKQK